MAEPHECSQGATLATICEQLNGIVRDIKDIKADNKTYLEDQKALQERVNQANIERAKYPSPETVTDYIRKIERHDVYFFVMGSVLTLLAMAVGGPIVLKIFGD